MSGLPPRLTTTTRSGSVTGNGRRNEKFTRLNIDAFTPIPSRRQSMASKVTHGDLRNNRNEYVRSSIQPRISMSDFIRDTARPL